MFRQLLLSIILVGGIYMSHPVNDEILENLYEEIYGELSELYPDYAEETLDRMATSITQQRFEDMCL